LKDAGQVKALLSSLSKKAKNAVFTRGTSSSALTSEGRAEVEDLCEKAASGVLAEEQTQILSCPEGNVLWVPGGAGSVHLAWYGDARKPWQVKDGIGIDVTEAVKEALTDKNTVSATKAIFGDPCPWVTKNLLVLAEICHGEELFCPGIVTWIYRKGGTLDAAVVPRDLPSLRRIICDKRMVKDHGKFAYHRALLAVRAARAAAKTVAWQSFDEAGELCPCCHSVFDWMSTARSKKQRPLSMTNCRACGLVVCVACASSRQALPELGILDPARVCDRCAWGGRDKGGDSLAAVGQAFAAAAETPQ